jgi:uncharacterized protein (TIGR04255 family)
MPVSLPDTTDTELTHAPLAVVVCQIRYGQNLRVSDTDAALKIHEDLGGRDGQYPTIEQQNVMSAQVEIGPMGLASLGAGGLAQRGWRLRSDDAKWVISVMPEFVGLETSAYTSWHGDFRDRLNALLTSIVEHVSPKIVDRIGLRYVNRLTDPDRTEMGDWVGTVVNELLGPIADASWAEGIQGFQQQIELELGLDRRCTFRQGIVLGEAGGIEGYLLDFDVYRQSMERFDLSLVMESLDALNDDALALFQKSLTPEYLASLRSE